MHAVDHGCEQNLREIRPVESRKDNSVENVFIDWRILQQLVDAGIDFFIVQTEGRDGRRVDCIETIRIVFLPRRSRCFRW